MSFLHDIFYGGNAFEINEDAILSLHKWAENNHSTTVPDVPIQKPVMEIEVPVMVVNAKPNYSKPRIQSCHATFFWCIFLATHGYSEYLRIGNRYQNKELEEKQKIMETLSKNPKQLKDGSIKLTNDAIQEILSGLLVSSSKEDFSVLVAYSKYYNKTIYVVFDCAYLVFSPNKDYMNITSTDANIDPTNGLEDVCVLYQTRKHPKYGGSYSLEFDLTLEKLTNICNTKLFMEHYAKPFRGISTYKVSDLVEMAKKIGILEPMKKTELYAKIVEKCCVGIQI